MPPYGSTQQTMQSDALQSFMPYLQQAQYAYGILGGEASPSSVMSLASQLMKQRTGGGLSAGQSQAVNKLSSAENLVDKYDQMLQQIGMQSGPVARLTGLGKSLGAKIGIAPNVRAYEGLRQGAVASIVRALGEAGSLSDTDIQRAIALVPSIYDSREEASLKLNTLKSIVSTNRENVMSLGSLPAQNTMPTGGLTETGLTQFNPYTM